MFEAASKALSQMFSAPLRAVLGKAIGLALILIVIIGIGLHRLLAALAASGAAWAEHAYGGAPPAVWELLLWVLSIRAGFGIVTGALFLMPAVTAFVGSFFVDEIAEQVERRHYPAEPPGQALPFLRAIAQGVTTALLALIVYLCALPFLLFAGFGVVVTGWSLRTAVVTGSVAGLLVAMYVADLIGRLDPSLDGVRYASVFRYYGQAIQHGIEPIAFVGVTAAAVALAALGALLFERRDLSV